MKILQVLSTLGQGGAEHFVIELTTELIQQGYECDVVTLFDVEKSNDLRKDITKITKHVSLNKKSGFDLFCFYKLYKFIKNGRYDIVHAHVNAIPYILLAAIFLPKVKFVATIHSEARREAGKSIMKWIRFFMFKSNICIPVTISEESKLSFDEYYNMDSFMVYNGVSKYNGVGIKPLKDNDEQILFIHPASCQPVKNQELLFKAFAKLVREFPNTKMIWLGSKDAYPLLFESLKNIMVSQIEYKGIVHNVRDYLIQADAMCLSSKMEGMPMTIIEAFSVGKPALCTSVGGIINMIDSGSNGMLSASLSVDDYYATLKSFCNLSKKDRNLMCQNALNSFSKFSIENTTRGYLKVYKNDKNRNNS